MTFFAAPGLLLLTLLLLCVTNSSSLLMPDSKELRELLSRYEQDTSQKGASGAAANRSRRAILWSDREEILQLHNKLRGNVYPSAADMEHMVWDDELERSATQWAEECQWDHGPRDLLKSIGQNLAVHWGRYRSPAFHVQAWYDEVKDYTYPYPSECNPWCPERCSGPMCTHYTQLVWATTNRVGCAVHVCPRMNVWGEIWENAVYLVCNYSPKGNWIGEAPYRHGRPCSQCPPSFGGGCRNNLCYKEKKYIHVPLWLNCELNVAAHNIKCETKLRDKCRGSTCNRHKCPANCLHAKGKVWGTVSYDAQSSICRAAIHAGVIDNNGGLVDITRTEKSPFFVRSTKNGIESLSKYKPANSFIVSKVEVYTADCYTTVAEICPFKRPSSHCPRFFCPANCKTQPSYWSPVIGSNIYADNSSICKAAIHAGVIKASGGLVDVLPLERRKSYSGVLRNAIQSESNTEGDSFRLFAVRVGFL
uniref:Cysteine-rich secretory protein LCCL domain containing 2 n=1 Tax=Oryzias melastigma TaxID=30732 RepID=A0A3B3CXG3_ORYME